MNKIFRRAVALFISAVMLICAIPFSYAAENISWSFEDGVLSITGAGEMKDYAVSHAPWFSVRESIKSVVVSSGVTSIGENAFYDCDSLEAVELPAGITEIGSGAFRDCGLLE